MKGVIKKTGFEGIRLAFVHDWLNGMRGGEKVLQVLCRAFPDADIYTLLLEKDKISSDILEHRIMVSALQRMPFAGKLYRYYLPAMPWFARSLDVSGYDLVLSISHCVAKGVFTGPAPHVCYCLTPMRYIWDMKDSYFYHGLGSSLKRAAFSLFQKSLRKQDVASSMRVNKFAAISRHIAERIKNCYSRESEVIYPPVDTGFYTSSKAVSRDDYYLAVSSLVPYKRVDIAVKAFTKTGKRLVVVGTGPDYRYLKKLAGPTVQFAGWVGDEELRAFYRNARALVFTANEDFGIVPVEAQACGCPVAAFGAGGALETIQDGKTGLFFNEQTPDAVIGAVERIERAEFDPEGFSSWTCGFSSERFIDGITSVMNSCRSLV